MLKSFKFAGNGSIEFTLPSMRKTTVIKKNETKILNVEEQDFNVVRQLGALKVRVTDVEEEAASVPEVTTVEAVPVEEPIESKVEESVRTYDIKELMSMTAAKLKGLADSLGVEYSETASKREIATAIIGKTNGEHDSN